MIGIAEIRKRVHGHALVREVDELPTGPIRIETAFLYPDGSSVDLFVTPEENSLCTRLSDLGQTHSAARPSRGLTFGVLRASTDPLA